MDRVPTVQDTLERRVSWGVREIEKIHGEVAGGKKTKSEVALTINKPRYTQEIPTPRSLVPQPFHTLSQSSPREKVI